MILKPEQELTLQNAFSFLTERYIFTEAQARNADKYFELEWPNQIAKRIMRENEKRWEKGVKLYAKQLNMQKATMRIIEKHTKEDYDKAVDDNLQKILRVERTKATIEDWTQASFEGFEKLCKRMPKVMTEATGFVWSFKQLLVREGENINIIPVLARSFSLDGEECVDNSDFYNDVHDYDAIVKGEGGEMSIQNFLEEEILSQRLIIMGDTSPAGFAQNYIKLQQNYMESLPSFSFPLTIRDIARMEGVSEFFLQADKFLYAIKDFDYENDGNRYFDMYPFLTQKAKDVLNEIYNNLQAERFAEEMRNPEVLITADFSLYKKESAVARNELKEQVADFRQEKLPDMEIYLTKQ